MRNDTAIENEILALKLLLEQNERDQDKPRQGPGPYKSGVKFRSSYYPFRTGTGKNYRERVDIERMFWNARIREMLEESIKVLTKRMSAEEISATTTPTS